MAAVNVIYTFIDEKGRSKTNKVHLPLGFTPAQYSEWAIAFGDILLNASGGAITEIGISLPLDLSAATLRAAAVGFADIAKKALFTVTSSVSGLFTKFFIPTWNKAFNVPNSDAVDTLDSDVQAYLDIVENGVTVSGVPIQVVDTRGNSVDEVTSSRAIFRAFN